MKNSIIGLKELRENADTYISQVEKGKSFIVVRRSEPVFKISPPEEAVKCTGPDKTVFPFMLSARPL